MIAKLGGINIAYKVSLLSKFLAKPQTWHIYQALHILKYLETHIDSKLSFGPLYHEVIYPHDPNNLIAEMTKVYVDVVEDLPTNAPKLRGKGVQLNCFLDEDILGLFYKIIQHHYFGTRKGKIRWNSQPLVPNLSRHELRQNLFILFGIN